MGKHLSKESSLTRRFHQLSEISKQSKTSMSVGGILMKQNNHYLKPAPSVGGHLTWNKWQFHIHFTLKSSIWLETPTALTAQPTDTSTATLPFLLIRLLMGCPLSIKGSSVNSHSAHLEIRTFNHTATLLKLTSESILSFVYVSACLSTTRTTSSLLALPTMTTGALSPSSEKRL